MSDNGVTIEQIADLVGHRTTIVTQKVYWYQLKPVISTSATAIPSSEMSSSGTWATPSSETRKAPKMGARLPTADPASRTTWS
jgi:hypothetical protein